MKATSLYNALSGHEDHHVCSFVKVNFSRGLLYTLSIDFIFHRDNVMIRFADRGHPFNSIDCDFEYIMYKLLHEFDSETSFIGTRINFTD